MISDIYTIKPNSDALGNRTRSMKFSNPQITKCYNKFYRDDQHPYHIYHKLIHEHVGQEMTIMDAGCGHGAPVLNQLKNKVKKCIGIDLTTFDKDAQDTKVHLLNSNMESLPIKSESIDLIISRSVLEHLPNPNPVFAEFSRVLKANGHCILLVPNLGDYVSIISKIIPNNLHPMIMAKAESRSQHDTFPTFYKANSYKQIKKLAESNAFEIISFEYFGQFPSHFSFSSVLFFLGSLYDRLICKYEALRFLRGWILTVIKKK